MTKKLLAIIFICILSVSVDTAFSEDFAVLKLTRITAPVGMPDTKAQKFAELRRYDEQ